MNKTVIHDLAEHLAAIATDATTRGIAQVISNTTLDDEHKSHALQTLRDIVELKGDDISNRLYAAACIEQENLSVAYQHLKSITTPTKDDISLLGLIGVKINDDEATDFLKRANYTDEDILLLQTLASYERGNKDPKLHEKRLHPFLQTSANANSTLGIMYFNNIDYINAMKYLRLACQLDDSEDNILNLLTCQTVANPSKSVAAIAQHRIYGKISIAESDASRRIHENHLNMPTLMNKISEMADYATREKHPITSLS